MGFNSALKGLILLKKRNVSDEGCKENEHTNFYSTMIFRKSCRLCDNTEKYDRARHATEDNNKVHARWMLGN